MMTPRMEMVFALLSLCEGTLQWRHNVRDGVSNHRRLECLLSRLFRRRSNKRSKLRVTGRCEGNSPVTGEFPSQKASDTENISIWWRHNDNYQFYSWLSGPLHWHWHDQRQGYHHRRISINGLPESTIYVNALAPVMFEWNFRFRRLILLIAGCGISCEILLGWMPLDLTCDNSPMAEVMAWFLQTTNHNLSQCKPRSMSPYGVTRPQCVKLCRLAYYGRLA